MQSSDSKLKSSGSTPLPPEEILGRGLGQTLRNIFYTGLEGHPRIYKSGHAADALTGPTV